MTFSVLGANGQEFLTKGVDNENTFNQDGAGFWNVSTAVTYQRSGSYYDYVSPLVKDVDNDGVNEIIVMSGTQLQVLNYTKGSGLLTEDTINIGSISATGYDIYQTPGIIDYDGDGKLEIIVHNITTALTYQHNSSGLTLEQFSHHLQAKGTGVMAKYPVVKCGAANQFKSGAVTCVYPIGIASRNLGLISYDLTNNTANVSNTTAFGNDDHTPENTHLVDLNNDNYLEVLYRVYDDANDDIYIKKFEIAVDNSIVQTPVAQHFLSSAAKFTDIIVAEMDGATGNGKEITWGFTSDGVNWNGYTVHADNSLYVSSYCGILDCPEGEFASFNLMSAPNTLYGVSVNDVCYYVRNFGNNDPGENIDTLHCLSLAAGTQTKETTFANTQNFSTVLYPSLYTAKLYGVQSLLLPQFSFKSDIIKQVQPQLTHNTHTIPVDYQKDGGLDIIGMNSSRIIYYDDNTDNENMQIDSIANDRNPLCLDYTYRFSLKLSDKSDDAGVCYASELYQNDTVITNFSSLANVTNPSTEVINYFADSVGSFKLVFFCKDVFHDTFRSETVLVNIVNSTTTCNLPDTSRTTTDFTTDEEQSKNQDFLADTDAIFDAVGATSKLAKTIILLLIMLAFGFAIMTKGGEHLGSNAVYALAIVEVVILIIGYYLGMVGVMPLVIIGLLASVVLAGIIMRPSTGG